MAKHLVICPYCKIKFDTNAEPFVKPSATRYAHPACYEKHLAEMTEEERDEEAFYKYAKQLFGEDFNYLVTKKLAERFIKENGYTYSGMLKALKWTYEIEGISTDRANGSIGLLPYTYNKARDYYYSLYLAKEANKNKDLSNYITSRTIEIESPYVYIKPHRLFNMEDEEE